MAQLPRWAGRASLPSLCPSKLAASCPSQLPRKGNECLASSGFAPLEQMVQILGFWGGKKRLSGPWGISSSDTRGLVPLLSLPHIGGFSDILVPSCPTGVGAGGPKSRGLGCTASTGRVWERTTERSQLLSYGSQEGTEGPTPSLSAPFDQNPLSGILSCPSPASVLPGP